MTGYSLTQTWNGSVEVISHWNGCGCSDCKPENYTQDETGVNQNELSLL